MKQERPEADYTFEEEEIAEARLAPLGWRAEGKASRKVMVRGGVIADAVGYGKTAVCLGLIDASNQLEPLESLAPPSNEFIYSKATLIVVPNHLTKQWESEGEFLTFLSLFVSFLRSSTLADHFLASHFLFSFSIAKKFLRNGYKVQLFMTFAHLRKFTVEDYQNADILIICTACFTSDIFWDSLAAFSAVGSLPKTKEPTRYWTDRFQDCLAGARAQVEILNEAGGSSKGVRKVLENIDAAFVEEERMVKEAIKRGEVRIGRKKFDRAAVEELYMEDVKKTGNKVLVRSFSLRLSLSFLSSSSVLDADSILFASLSQVRTAAQRSRDDMFGLNTSKVRLDWTKLKAVPLHAIRFVSRLLFFSFSFASSGEACADLRSPPLSSRFERVIVDEFTYVEGKARSAINALNSHSTWVLSGTPNIQSFKEINE